MIPVAHALLLLLLSAAAAATSRAHSNDYFKFDLRRSSALPSPAHALAADTIRLSFLSSSHPSSLSAPIVSAASSGSGQYLVDIHLGSPPQRLRLIADTGSDLTWSRCSACRSSCRRRRRHGRPATAFLPRRSSSFRPFHCYHPFCRLLPRPSRPPRCNRTRLHSPCRFLSSYADRSSASGFFSVDVATINSTSGRLARIPSLPFGCAFNVASGPTLASADGILGLGRGPISFISRAARRLGPSGEVFSYCLLDFTLSPAPISFLIVGAAAPKSNRNPNFSFTPMISNTLSPTFYYVRILGAAVDGAALPINPKVWALDPESGAGGTVIDSGTTLSFFPAPAYRQIVAAMARHLRKHFAVVPGPPGFDLCVNASSSGGPGARWMPRLEIVMEGGAVMKPPPANYFLYAGGGATCLALQPVANEGSGFGVIGNLMQQGFLFVFDRRASRIGFSRSGCAAA